MSKKITQQPTIAAVATAKGVGGVGIVRLSGTTAKDIAQRLLPSKLPKPRVATYTSFVDQNKKVIDSGLVIYFPSPHSYTGEDVVEFHGHGGSFILDCLLQETIKLGASLAPPGEFTKRAFLNDKIDLLQAEAVSDLINATSKEAALAASNTLSGVFSEKISDLSCSLINLRMHVEASIDFPEEEIDFLQDNKIKEKLENIKTNIDSVLSTSKVGTRLVDGINAVIIGKPNAGKSSLLNALAKDELAIVTDIEGTTRDALSNSLNIKGITVNITDTAGLRDTSDIIEKEGIKRAISKINKSELVLFVLDGSAEKSLDPFDVYPDLKSKISPSQYVVSVVNKTDITNISPRTEKLSENNYKVFLSAKEKSGVELLEDIILEISGLSSGVEGAFSARRRHINAIESAKKHILRGEVEFLRSHAGEILAEELRIANQFLSEILGEFSSDDLLGKIFSEFCIGK